MSDRANLVVTDNVSCVSRKAVFAYIFCICYSNKIADNTGHSCNLLLYAPMLTAVQISKSLFRSYIYVIELKNM